MLATLERIEIIESAEALGELIRETDIAERYRHYYHKLQEDANTRKKIAAFVKMKELYEDVQRFGRYHPEYKEIMRKTRELKREMDLDENVANFRKAENDLQALLDQISVIVSHAVSANIKVDTGNPFFDKGSSCSGGCGTGSGCGCSA
ncbi:YlbF family regulator [Siminovitchia fortis]|uniref:YlbF family regulator n=1 Tax=Siminovitchia fortis TaxID=254758 RepID=A0A443IPA4_9BACI|nr:YlbF family regulator [Siminovitchia fortis]RWR08215.1 YlbF family regulator [Siminovitchia fortis]WHY83414.1 YlbF family regulator [Siminovitchia fortis]